MLLLVLHYGDKCGKVAKVSGGDPVGVLGSWPPTFWQWGSKCARTPPPTFTAMLLYMACNP